MVQAKDGWLEEEETHSEKQAEDQSQVVALLPLWGMERVERSNDSPQKLGLDCLGGLLWKDREMERS